MSDSTSDLSPGPKSNVKPDLNPKIRTCLPTLQRSFNMYISSHQRLPHLTLTLSLTPLVVCGSVCHPTVYCLPPASYGYPYAYAYSYP